MLGVFAEFETNLRRERQLEGIRQAKARGVYQGRKPSIDVAEIRRLRECAWERFSTFACEPERRAVGSDCRLTVAGVIYEVDAESAGETVVVWWGLFDQELWVEREEERFGPYHPVGRVTAAADK